MASAIPGVSSANVLFAEQTQSKLSSLDNVDIFSEKTTYSHKQGLMCKLHNDITKAQSRSLTGKADIKLTQQDGNEITWQLSLKASSQGNKGILHFMEITKENKFLPDETSVTARSEAFRSKFNEFRGKDSGDIQKDQSKYDDYMRVNGQFKFEVKPSVTNPFHKEPQTSGPDIPVPFKIALAFGILTGRPLLN